MWPHGVERGRRGGESGIDALQCVQEASERRPRPRTTASRTRSTGSPLRVRCGADSLDASSLDDVPYREVRRRRSYSHEWLPAPRSVADMRDFLIKMVEEVLKLP